MARLGRTGPARVRPWIHGLPGSGPKGGPVFAVCVPSGSASQCPAAQPARRPAAAWTNLRPGKVLRWPAHTRTARCRSARWLDEDRNRASRCGLSTPMRAKRLSRAHGGPGRPQCVPMESTIHCLEKGGAGCSAQGRLRRGSTFWLERGNRDPVALETDCLTFTAIGTPVGRCDRARAHGSATFCARPAVGLSSVLRAENNRKTEGVELGKRACVPGICIFCRRGG